MENLIRGITVVTMDVSGFTRVKPMRVNTLIMYLEHSSGFNAQGADVLHKQTPFSHGHLSDDNHTSVLSLSFF